MPAGTMPNDHPCRSRQRGLSDRPQSVTNHVMPGNESKPPDIMLSGNESKPTDYQPPVWRQTAITETARCSKQERRRFIRRPRGTRFRSVAKDGAAHRGLVRPEMWPKLTHKLLKLYQWFNHQSIPYCKHFFCIFAVKKNLP